MAPISTTSEIVSEITFFSLRDVWPSDPRKQGPPEYSINPCVWIISRVICSGYFTYRLSGIGEATREFQQVNRTEQNARLGA